MYCLSYFIKTCGHGCVFSFSSSCLGFFLFSLLILSSLLVGWMKERSFDEVLLAEEEMAENGRVHPDCVNAANPYHECGVSCLEKIAQGKGRRERKKSDYHNGLKQDRFSKKIEGQRRAHPSCPKASNPYHECGVHCSNRTGESNLQGRKESDFHNGIKQDQPSKKMEGQGRVDPSCPKASNPYHECGVHCSNSSGETHMQGRKQSDNHHGKNQDQLSKKIEGQRRADPSCPKASNPYHECGVHCSNRTGILDTALSFGRKKKGPDFQSDSPQVLENGYASKSFDRADDPSPPSSFSNKKNMDPGGSQSFSSQQNSEESYSLDNSNNKGQVLPYESIPKSGKLTPDGPTNPSKASLDCFAIVPPTEQEGNEKIRISPKAAAYPFVNGGEKGSHGPGGLMNFTFSGISGASEESDDEEETHSVISDSCVSVGKYHVRPHVSSTLQAIFDKYGDIAAGSKLESASMRAYYLECLCLVVQELQSTSFKNLTKSKIKEMFAVLKDVESAQIDISWLHSILAELSEAMELNNQHQAAEEAKAKCDNAIESTRKELDTLLEDLAQKEKAVADAKQLVEETRTRLGNLELESSKLGADISSIWSRVEKFHRKSFADEIL